MQGRVTASAQRRKNLKTQLYGWAYHIVNTHDKQSFLKTLFKLVEFQNAAFAFSCGVKISWKRSFSIRWLHDNNVISLPECFSNTNPKITGECCVFLFLRHIVDEKYFMRFQSENTVLDGGLTCGSTCCLHALKSTLHLLRPKRLRKIFIFYL